MRMHYSLSNETHVNCVVETASTDLIILNNGVSFTVGKLIITGNYLHSLSAVRYNSLRTYHNAICLHK